MKTIGSLTSQRRVVVLDRAAVQTELDVVDRALMATLGQQRYPERSVAELHAAMPNQWIALLPTRVDDAIQITAGRVLASAGDWESFDRLVRELRQTYPKLAFDTFFTGPYTFGREFVFA